MSAEQAVDWCSSLLIIQGGQPDARVREVTVAGREGGQSRLLV